MAAAVSTPGGSNAAQRSGDRGRPPRTPWLLKRLNPNLRNITYDISDLYRYIDNLADLSALVYHPQLNAYIPCNRDWIKQRAFQHLKRMAT